MMRCLVQNGFSGKLGYAIKTVLCLAVVLGAVSAYAQKKPKVWIISDGSDKSIKNEEGKTIGDPDDISALANYLLMSNMFDTRAIVVGSVFNISMDRVGSQKKWADEYLLKAYLEDLPNLNKNIGGYQDSILFLESFLRESPVKYKPRKIYLDLSDYSTVQALFDEIDRSDDLINVLCWGTLTEPAILTNHCLAMGRQDILQKVRFISHWTHSYFRVGSMEHPEAVHNAFNDANAAAYIKQVALDGHIKFYECSASGQYGIVEGSPRGREFYDQFSGSAIGRVYLEGKYAEWMETVDDSDSATHWALLGDWGLSLGDINSNGTNFPEIEQANEKAFHEWAPRIRNELLRRAKAAQ